MSDRPIPSSPLRVVIAGSTGRLGRALVRELSGSFNLREIEREGMDLADPSSIADALEPFDFDLLILPAALTAVDYCENNPQEAFAVNAEGPGLIARICAQKNARMVLISTDFVFDGTKEGAYSEDDAPNPLSVYGESKLRGEREVLAAASRNLVVRVSWLYGSGRPAFPEWIIDKAGVEGRLALPGDKFGSPTLTTDLAGMLLPLLHVGQASGVVHLCNSGSCSQRDWGQACIDSAREAGKTVLAQTIDANTMADVPAFVAKRPPNSTLDTSRYSSLTGIMPRPWNEALREYLMGNA